MLPVRLGYNFYSWLWFLKMKSGSFTFSIETSQMYNMNFLFDQKKKNKFFVLFL